MTLELCALLRDHTAAPVSTSHTDSPPAAPPAATQPLLSLVPPMPPRKQVAVQAGCVAPPRVCSGSS